MTQNLGVIVTQVRGEIESISSFLDDPITVAYGCGDELLPLVSKHAMQRIEAILRSAGFERYVDFADEVEARTSSKWMYFYSGLDHLVDVFYEEFFRS